MQPTFRVCPDDIDTYNTLIDCITDNIQYRKAIILSGQDINVEYLKLNYKSYEVRTLDDLTVNNLTEVLTDNYKLVIVNEQNIFKQNDVPFVKEITGGDAICINRQLIKPTFNTIFLTNDVDTLFSLYPELNRRAEIIRCI